MRKIKYILLLLREKLNRMKTYVNMIYINLNFQMLVVTDRNFIIERIIKFKN